MGEYDIILVMAEAKIPEVKSPLPLDIQEAVKLSDYTKALIASLQAAKPRLQPDDISRINVSQTVSFLAIVYEKLRNVIDYREEHLVRRAAIERIIKRRLTLNLEGAGEAENLVRELLWARYFPNGSLGDGDIHMIQKIINKYLTLRKTLLATHKDIKYREYLWQFLLDLLTCEIEESLTPVESNRDASSTYFIYQTLRHKVKIEGLTDDQKDIYFLIAIEKSFRRSDQSYQRYHLFITFYKPIAHYTDEEAQALASNIATIFKKIDELRASPYVDKLVKYTRKQLPSYLILFDILHRHKHDMKTILSSASTLWEEVQQTCQQKYGMVKSRLRNLAIRSLIYIFLTKMLFAIILEYPVSNFLYGEVYVPSIVINSLFPPILMLFIVLLNKLPDQENTKRIYQRIIGIIDADRTYETQVAYMTKKQRTRRPILIFGFTILYSCTFLFTLFLIYKVLTFLHFNLVSQAIFIFFVSIVSFFAYRVRQVANEYRLVEKTSIIGPVVDFFFLPIISIGKFLSSEVARFNFFILIFDFIIEAPFKFIMQVIEEWISFVKQRKEDIV